jgi:hypothetical protein
MARQEAANPSKTPPHLSDDVEPDAPLALGIHEVCRRSGLGRTSIYAAIKSGDLIARKWKRRTVVLAEDLASFLRRLPECKRALPDVRKPPETR